MRNTLILVGVLTTLFAVGCSYVRFNGQQQTHENPPVKYHDFETPTSDTTIKIALDK